MIANARKRERERRSVPPRETEYGALRVGVYDYLFRLKKAKLLPKLEAHIALTRFTRGPNVGAAGSVLRLIALDRSAHLTAPRRSRVARELDFALRQNIDPELILGFLYEIGSQTDVLGEAKKTRTPEAVQRYRLR